MESSLPETARTDTPQASDHVEPSLHEIAQDDTPQTTPPLRKGTPHLTRDQRRDILLMHSLKKTEEEIAAHLYITLRQVTYTIQTGRATPRKSSGRPSKLIITQIDAVVNFIIS